jgi:SAM-dependent methyltransferase
MIRAAQGKPNRVPAADDFDQRTGMDTQTPVKIYKLDSLNANYVHGQGYSTLPAEEFKKALLLLPSKCRDYVFFDIGCGKGKEVFLATEAGFKKAIGVELSPMLVEIANRNRQKWRMANEIQFVTGDASEFVFEDHNSVVFLYHPFDEVVMKRLVGNLERCFRKSDVWVVYVSPVKRKCFEGWQLHADEGWAVVMNKKADQARAATAAG